MFGFLTRLFRSEHPADLLCERSSEWPRVRAEHLRKHPRCEVCGSKVNVVPHHVVPVHLDKSKELCEGNLISLCENRFHCHLLFGHLGHFASWNSNVWRDAMEWQCKLLDRPRA